MVNTGKPSTACEPCRQKRVKCNETRPACARCSANGTECSYRALNRWRSMNAWATYAVKNPTKKSTGKTSTNASHLPSVVSSADNDLDTRLLGSISLPSLSASQSRRGMQNAFCELFYPPEIQSGTQSLFDDASSLISPGRRPEMARLAMIDAGDAMCLLQAALASSRSDLAYKSVDLYSRALARLRSAIAVGHWTSFVEPVLHTIYFALKYETFLRHTFAASAWQCHTKAFLGVLVAMDENGFRVASDRVRQILRFSSIYALGYGLINKNAVRFPPLEWMESGSAEQSKFLRLAFQIPQCLGRLSACGQPSAQQDALALALQEALHLRYELELCVARPESLFTAFEEVDSGLAFPDFEHMVEPGLRCVFPRALAFHNPHAMLTLKTYWVGRLALTEAILEAHSRCEATLAPKILSANEVVNLEAQACESADNLCKSLAHLTSRAYRTCGFVSFLEPLHFAEMYFDRIEAAEKLAWCRSFRKRNNLGRKIAEMVDARNLSPSVFIAR